MKEGERLLVRRRPAGVVNAGLWEFPNIEVAVNEKNIRAAAAPFRIADPVPFVGVRHSITRYRILLEAYRAELPAGSSIAKTGAVWKSASEINKLPFTSAHRKVMLRANASDE